jgi:predicted transcriptional regulator of viral defense system
MQLDTYSKLYQIAEAQAGYFPTAQAAVVGVDRKRLARYVVAGRLERIRRSVDRLPPFPRSPHEDLFVAWLEAGPRSVISHDSALALYELSDALPAAIHVTVPRTASRRHPGLRIDATLQADPTHPIPSAWRRRAVSRKATSRVGGRGLGGHSAC